MTEPGKKDKQAKPRKFPLHHRLAKPIAKPDFPKIEKEILAYWKDNSTFRKTVEDNPTLKPGKEYVFYDGPPFANGLPHYGHLLTGYIKDLVGRYQTMNGNLVERRFGWDTHGLPAEIETERLLGIEGKHEIEGEGGIGIEAFNQACYDSVLKYTLQWQEYVTRQARWVDFENDYKTLDNSYMESVIWAFKTLYERGLIYEGFKVLPYCFHDQTPLSNHELGLDDVYQERTDKSVTVAVKLLDDEGEPTGELALIWTTTPWTLPSNQAIAVGPDLTYVELIPTAGQFKGYRVILAEALVENYLDELGLTQGETVCETTDEERAETEGKEPTGGCEAVTKEKGDSVANSNLQAKIQALVSSRIRGEKLLGRRYAPIFPFLRHYKKNSKSPTKIKENYTFAKNNQQNNVNVCKSEVGSEQQDYLRDEEKPKLGEPGKVFDGKGRRESYLDAAELGENCFTILAGDFVTTEDGTGLVHMSPAFGEDDMTTCQKAEIKTQVTVGPDGRFNQLVPDYQGELIFDANQRIIDDLECSSGPLLEVEEDYRPLLVHAKDYTHSYPHCWRCRNPLIYRASQSWFVEVTKFQQRLVELNQQINWVPAHIKDGQFGNWLKNARDWSISRSRFWGAPIPVWKSTDPNYPRLDVYGSFAELERDFGVTDINLHRPFVDQLTRPNPDDPTGRSLMVRVPDVFDCWFESGSMPFAQVHYPFENTEWFESHYPGDFITEYIGQTRGWFYTLHVLATALFDRPSFLNCISHGIVLGNDGKKMSKSLRNYPDVYEVFDTYGSDAMRFFLLSSPVVRGGNLIVTEEAIRNTVRQVLLPLWNIYYFFTLYANACNEGEGIKIRPLADFDSQSRLAPVSLVELTLLDRYILSKTKGVIEEARAAYDAYDLVKVAELFQEHLEVIANWYIRTQRQRFWQEDEVCFSVLYQVILGLVQAMAPILPLLCEEIYRGLTGAESVHLCSYPTFSSRYQDEPLVTQMDRISHLVSTGQAIRKKTQIRVRQPLAKLMIISEQPGEIQPYYDLIKEQLNVKEVVALTFQESGASSYQVITLHPQQFPPQIRKLTSRLFAEVKQGNWRIVEGKAIFDQVLLEEETPLTLSEPAFSLSERASVVTSWSKEAISIKNLNDIITTSDSALAQSSLGDILVFHTVISEELAEEGYVRDLIRQIQETRKNTGLDVSDKIELRLKLEPGKVSVVEKYLELVQRETLSQKVTYLTWAKGDAEDIATLKVT